MNANPNTTGGFMVKECFIAGEGSFSRHRREDHFQAALETDLGQTVGILKHFNVKCQTRTSVRRAVAPDTKGVTIWLTFRAELLFQDFLENKANVLYFFDPLSILPLTCIWVKMPNGCAKDQT